ncbi:MAG: DUF3352 domain-containing protein [bacterium]
MPKRMFGLAITAGLVAVAAVVGGAILFTSSKASEVNLTTASLVPADAGVYFALNTDLSSSQWVSTFRLAERLGADSPEDELHNSVDEAGFDWEDDVAPFLGGNAAVYLQGVSISDVSAEGAVIVRCKDPKKALGVLEDNLGPFDDEKFKGVEYHAMMEGFVAVIGQHLVIAFDEDSIKSVIDVSKGDTASLASVDDFQKLRDELTGNFLGFVYVSTENLVGDFLLDDPVVKAALTNAGAADLVFQPAAWVIGAKKDGFEFQAASVGKSGVISPMLAPRQSKLVKYVPADASLFFSTVDIADTWNQVMKDARPEIDKAIRQEGQYNSLDDALKDAGRQLGITSVEEIIQLLNGETTVAAWFPDGNEENAEGVLIAEVDQQKASDLLKKIVSAKPSVSRARTEKVGNTEMTVFKDEDNEEAAYAFLDGNLVLGTKEAVTRVLGNNEPSLGSLKKYNQTVEQMPTGLGTYAYFNLSSLLRLAEGGVPADLSAAERALSGLIINGVDERGIIRLSGILTVED